MDRSNTKLRSACRLPPHQAELRDLRRLIGPCTPMDTFQTTIHIHYLGQRFTSFHHHRGSKSGAHRLWDGSLLQPDINRCQFPGSHPGLESRRWRGILHDSGASISLSSPLLPGSTCMTRTISRPRGFRFTSTSSPGIIPYQMLGVTGAKTLDVGFFLRSSGLDFERNFR